MQPDIASLPALLELSENVHAALKLWHRDDSEHSPLERLMLYQTTRRMASSNRQATNEVVYDGIRHLAVRHPDAAHLLRLRFLDHQTAHAMANLLNVGESTLYALQREAIERLAEVLLDLEQKASAMRQHRLYRHLEGRSYGKLVGVEGHIGELARTLLASDQATIICVTGMGGIGKTALADALLRHMMPNPAFDDFGWVTARQVAFVNGSIRPVIKPVLTAEALIHELLLQLADEESIVGGLTPLQAQDVLRLRLQKPHLIVVDNLETVQDVEALLPTLRDLAGPSKFVLTSRHSYFHESAIRRFVVPELSLRDAIDLIRSEACLQNLAALNDARDDELRTIYQTVGGNPLVLRLVIARCCTQSLGEVLTDLAKVRGMKTETLYRYIYHSSWNLLTSVDQSVLLAMIVFSEAGATREDLAVVTDLPPGQVGDAIETLAGLNLIDCHRLGLHDAHYTIHQLTRRFLEQQVHEWTA